MRRVLIVVFLAAILSSGTVDASDDVGELHARINDLEQELLSTRNEVRILVERLAGLERLVDVDDRSLTAETLRVVDTRGVQRASLSTTFGLPALTFYDSSGGLLLYMSGGSHVPSAEEWGSLLTTAYSNSEMYLTDNLVSASMTVEHLWWSAIEADSPSYLISVNTKTQPGWNVYIGNGRFSVSDRVVRAAYRDAAQYIVSELLMGSVAAVPHEEILIAFYINGVEVGYWRDGEMILAGE